MADFAQERTEQATPRKLEKAREEGQVARSMELNSVIVICFGFLTIYFLGPLLIGNLSALMKRDLSGAPLITVSQEGLRAFFSEQFASYGIIAGPILIGLAAFAFMINVAQVGFKFSGKAITPRFDNFSPAKGFKRIFSRRALIELFRDVLKTIVIAYVAYEAISGWLPQILLLGDHTAGEVARELGRLSLLLAVKISAVLLVLAMFDFAYQRFEFASNLKMSRQEVKEELKDTEGNPVIKARVRQIQREMARQRMMQDVLKADVVVTNPTHIAVALKYDPSEMPAPIVLAKGQRLLAEKIKEIAREHKIPVIENKPLAQSLFKIVDVGAFIPATLYRAVAEVLAYIYRLKDNGGPTRG